MHPEFENLIDQLKVQLTKESSVLRNFTIKEIVDTYASIKDHQNKIGSYTAHYEVRLKSENILSVEIHFEDRINIKYRDIFQVRIGKDLPVNTNWVTFFKTQCIEYTDGTTLTIYDPDILENICCRLEYLEDNFGNKIRVIMDEIKNLKKAERKRNKT